MGLSALGKTEDWIVHPFGPCAIASTAVLLGLPFAPLQDSVNERSLEPDMTMFWDPINGCEPFQSPLAVHDVALPAFQFRVADWPGSTELGLTESVNVAAGGIGG